MLITLVIASILVLGLVMWVAVYKRNGWGYAMEFLLLPLWLLGLLCFNTIPINDYPNQANVTLQDNTEESTIYFKDFTQDNNIITIQDYAVWSVHWTDFKSYDVKHDLKITLTDNDNKFQYKDRQSEKEFNKPIPTPKINTAIQ